LLRNNSADTIMVEAINVSVYDRDQRLVLRRLIDDNGSSPSIETVPRRRIAPGGRILIFNPFHTFTTETELHELRYEFRLRSGKRSDTVNIKISPSAFEHKTRLRLPLRGAIIVYDAHDYYAHHRRLNFADAMGQQLGINANFMRYAYDFIPVDSLGNMNKGDIALNESWLGFGAEVLAPGNGRVVQLNDRAADDRQIDMAAVMKEPIALYGNYLVIDHLNGEFSLLGHIKQGSARVHLGEMVKVGEHVADVGAAGSSSMPHLHYELRTAGGVRGVEGLPSYFEDYVRLVGSRRISVKKGTPLSGDVVRRNEHIPRAPR
ncbi:MAG: M23 family metallopeptidase, partial [Gemmatimonadaceae bacterium]